MLGERIRGGLKKARQGAKEGLLFFRKNEVEKNFGISEDSNGQLYIDGEPKEGPRGPYDRILDFGKQNHTMGTIVEIKRYTRARSSNLTILGAEGPSMRQAMCNVSSLINNPEYSQDNPQDRFCYQETIMPVFEKGAKELHDELDRQGVLESHDYVICGPLRGGEFTVAALIYNARKIGWEIPFDRIACYELKRVLMPNDQLFIGARLGYWPETGPYTTTVIADDCVASDRSGTTTIKIAEEFALGELSGKSLRQMSEDERKVVLERRKYRRPVVMVAAASQQGIINFEMKDVYTITGEVVFSLNSSLYLMRTPEEGFAEGDYFVGDMGSWLGRLPYYFNDKAPWNEVRKTLVDYWCQTDKLPPSLRKINFQNWT